MINVNQNRPQPAIAIRRSRAELWRTQGRGAGGAICSTYIRDRGGAQPIRDWTAIRDWRNIMCNMCTRDIISEDTAAPPAAPERSSSKSARIIERMKKKHNIVTDPSCCEKQKEVEYQPDLLSISTQFSKVAYDIFKRGLVHLQESKAYVWVFNGVLRVLELFSDRGVSLSVVKWLTDVMVIHLILTH